MSSAKNNKQQPKQLAYRCSHCLTPSETLYRQYSSSVSTIKLTICEHCGENVDPYCEREWLLVLIDAALLRKEAYRHIFFNRLETFTWMKILQYAAASCALHAAILREAQEVANGDAKVVGTNAFLGFFVKSLLRLVTDIASSWAVLGASRPDSKTDSEVIDSFPLLCMAWILPTSFHLVAVFVQTWESTATVRLLGSVLVFAYQTMAVQAITEAVSLNGSLNNLLRIMFTVLLLRGFSSVAIMIQSGDMTCSGVYIQVMKWSLCLT
jgi:hypothetical protein